MSYELSELELMDRRFYEFDEALGMPDSEEIQQILNAEYSIEDILRYEREAKDMRESVDSEMLEWAKNYKATGDIGFMFRVFEGHGVTELFDALADAILAGKMYEFFKEYYEVYHNMYKDL